MKKITIIILSLFLISTTLTSCAGIGDGALIDNVLTNGSIECRITAHDEKISDVLDEITLKGKEAEELHAYFTESEYYEALDSTMYPRSFTVSFYSYDENGESVPMHDSEGMLNEFFVQDTDTVYRDESYLGRIKGVYEKLFGYIIETGSTGGYFCNISQSQTGHAVTRASGGSVRAIYQTLVEGEYLTDNMYPSYEEQERITLAFWGAEEATYYIYSNDYVMEFDSQSDGELYRSKGTLTGIYQKSLAMLVSALNRVSEDEEAAGYKLNCLNVIIAPAISRAYSISDFENVGCTYIDVASNNYTIYFDSCSVAELEEKIAVLKTVVGVEEVNKIYIGHTYDTDELQ